LQEENDDNYKEEQDAGDEFDSDFGEDVRYYIS
jgi:vacuolar protein sorting-associated protein 72